MRSTNVIRCVYIKKKAQSASNDVVCVGGVLKQSCRRICCVVDDDPPNSGGGTGPVNGQKTGILSKYLKPDNDKDTLDTVHLGVYYQCDIDCIRENNKCSNCSVYSKSKVWCDSGTLSHRCMNKCCEENDDPPIGAGTNKDVEPVKDFELDNDKNTIDIDHDGIDYCCGIACIDLHNKCQACEVENLKVWCEGGVVAHGCRNTRCCDKGVNGKKTQVKDKNHGNGEVNMDTIHEFVNYGCSIDCIREYKYSKCKSCSVNNHNRVWSDECKLFIAAKIDAVCNDLFEKAFLQMCKFPFLFFLFLHILLVAICGIVLFGMVDEMLCTGQICFEKRLFICLVITSCVIDLWNDVFRIDCIVIE